MTTMIEARGAEYVERWIAQMVDRFHTTEANINYHVSKRGVAQVGDLTPQQAKAVMADLAYYDRQDRIDYDAMQRRADAMIPSCGNCGDCPRCC